jgi:hypothetical protein
MSTPDTPAQLLGEMPEGEWYDLRDALEREIAVAWVNDEGGARATRLPVPPRTSHPTRSTMSIDAILRAAWERQKEERIGTANEELEALDIYGSIVNDKGELEYCGGIPAYVPEWLVDKDRDDVAVLLYKMIQFGQMTDHDLEKRRAGMKEQLENPPLHVAPPEELVAKVVAEAKTAASYGAFVDTVMDKYPELTDHDGLIEAIVDEALYNEVHGPTPLDA